MRSLRSLADGAARALLWCLGWASLIQAGLFFKPLPAMAWILAGCVAFLLYPRLGRARWRRRRAALLGLRAPGLATPWIGGAMPPFLAGVVLLILVHLRLTTDEGPVQFTYAYDALPLGWLVIPLVVGVEAPLVEELALRGFLQGRVARVLGDTIGGAIGAAIFALIHLSRAWLFHYFMVGALLAFARVSTRSVWAAVALHSAMNLFMWSLRGAPELVNGWKLASDAVPTPWLAAASAACYATSALLLRAAGRARRSHALARARSRWKPDSRSSRRLDRPMPHQA